MKVALALSVGLLSHHFKAIASVIPVPLPDLAFNTRHEFKKFLMIYGSAALQLPARQLCANNQARKIEYSTARVGAHLKAPRISANRASVIFGTGPKRC